MKYIRLNIPSSNTYDHPSKSWQKPTEFLAQPKVFTSRKLNLVQGTDSSGPWMFATHVTPFSASPTPTQPCNAKLNRGRHQQAPAQVPRAVRPIACPPPTPVTQDYLEPGRNNGRAKKDPVSSGAWRGRNRISYGTRDKLVTLGATGTATRSTHRQCRSSSRS